MNRKIRKIRKEFGSKKVFLIFPIVLLSPSTASAQVRFDLGALGSFQQRFGGTAEGGALTIDGHVAVFPLLRVGAWATAEASKPVDSTPARAIVGGGLRVKIVPPWPRGVWRTWIATGFGYDGLASEAGGGGFFEVPAILGASYRMRKPWVFLMELSARPGFGFWGSYYQRTATDVLSIALSFGFGFDG